MALRVVLVAARNCTPGEFREAFSLPDNAPVEESGGYVWYQTSIWAVDRSKIESGVNRLAGPLLLMDTQDASCWNLRLEKQGMERFVFHHAFSLLDLFRKWSQPDEVDEDADDDYDYSLNIDDMVDEWAMYGDPLPEALVDKLRPMPREEALRSFLKCQAEHIADALARYEIPHDRDGVISIITGEAVTNAELDTDVGSFPRFLVSLGFGQFFQEWLAEQQKIDEEPEDYCVAEEIPLFDFEKVRKNALAPVLDGSVALPLERLNDVFRIAWFCDDAVECGLEISLPTTSSPDFRIDEEGWYHCRYMDNGIELTVSDPAGLLVSVGAGLMSQLTRIPNGSYLHMATWGESTDAGRHRYAGKVLDGLWQIDRIFPAVRKERLEQALDLCTLIKSEDFIFASDEAEVQSVLEASETDYMLHEPALSHDGLRFVLENWQREYLVRRLFWQRFGEVWNVAVAVERERKGYQNFERMMEQATTWIPKIPTTGKVVYKGEFDEFLEVDVSALSDPFLEKMRETEKEIREAGFDLIGDITGAKKTVDVLIHGFKHSQENIYAALLLGSLGQTAIDCFTRFTEGASLTTTTMAEMQSDAEKKQYFMSSDATSFKGLLADHLSGIDDHRKKGREPAALEPNLIGLAKEIDRFMMIQKGSGSRALEGMSW